METADCSENVAQICRTTWRHTSQEQSLQKLAWKHQISLKCSLQNIMGRLN